MKRYFLVPIHTTPLVLVVTFSIGQVLAIKAGFMGIPWGLLLCSWFFKYCFVLFDSVVAGEEEPPVLSIEMVNPISEQRPLVLAALIVAEGMLVASLRTNVAELVAIAVGVGFTLVLPAHIGVLGFTGNALKAVWPPALLGLIWRLGRDYLLLNVTALLIAGAAYWMATHGTALWATLIATQLLLLLMFTLVAGALFEHRLELGIDSQTRQERLAARAAREHQIERGRMLDVAYSAFRVRKPLEGWQVVEAWLRAHVDLSEHRAVLKATSEWDDVRVADKLANDLVTTLLAKRATGEALSIAEQRLATNPAFQLSPAAIAVRMAELAGAAGKKALQRRLTPPGG